MQLDSLFFFHTAYGVSRRPTKSILPIFSLWVMMALYWSMLCYIWVRQKKSMNSWQHANKRKRIGFDYVIPLLNRETSSQESNFQSIIYQRYDQEFPNLLSPIIIGLLKVFMKKSFKKVKGILTIKFIASRFK